VYVARQAVDPLPTHLQEWSVAIPAHGDGWMRTPFAYSPLWQGRVNDHTVPLREDELGLLEVYLPAGGPVALELAHRPGVAERVGVTLSVVSALAIGFVWLRQPRRS
jgi:hypothetical protein